MEQLRIALRITRAGVSSGNDCGYLRAAKAAMAPRSSSAPERKTASLLLRPLLTEIRKFPVTKLAWSLVRNGTCKSCISLSATPPSTEWAELEAPERPDVFVKKGRR